MFKKQRHLMNYSWVVLVTAATSVAAQEIDRKVGADATGHRDNADVALVEIVVTANRRNQIIDDVGASVDSLEGSSLPSRGVLLTSDLQKLVPGFSAADSGVNFPVYSLRGIGLNDPSLAANPTVAISVDEVPLPYAAMTQGEILDIQRVEVVKGPQGTLYGLNATGGAINYIPVRPGDVFSVGADLGYGRFNTTTGRMFISGPVASTLRARLAITGTHADAWQQNYTRSDSMGKVARGAYRVLFDWQPLDRLQLDLNLNGWIDGSDSQATRVVAFRPQVPANVPLLPDVFSSPIAPADSRAANWNPLRDYSRDDRFTQVSLKASYTLTDSLALTSISAYSDYKSDAFNDRDGMAPSAFEFTTEASIDSVYQELRLSGDSNTLTWSAGGNFRKDRTHDLNSTDTSSATNTFVAGLKLNLVDFYADQDVETYALFADGELRIAPRVSMVAGVRFTRDDRKFEGSTCDVGDGETSGVFTVLANTFRAGRGLPALAPIPAGSCVTLSPDTLEPGVVHDDLVEDNVSFRAQLNFHPTTDSLTYASYSRGYKAGSFATVSGVFTPIYGPATQERVDAVEIGFNSTHLGRRLRLHGAAFHYDYDDKQFRGRVLDPVIGSLQKLVNIPRSVIRGFELDATATPLRGFVVSSAITYVHTEVKEFTGVNLFGQIENFAGQTLPYTPPWSANFAAQYDWPLGNGSTAYVGTDVIYRSRTSGFLGDDPPVEIREYTTLDLRAGIAFAERRWEVSVWGNNVTNSRYTTSAMRVGDTLNNYAARPVTYGVQLSFRH